MAGLGEPFRESAEGCRRSSSDRVGVAEGRDPEVELREMAEAAIDIRCGPVPPTFDAAVLGDSAGIADEENTTGSVQKVGRVARSMPRRVDGTKVSRNGFATAFGQVAVHLCRLWTRNEHRHPHLEA